MKKITLLSALFLSAISFAQISINEIDSDQTGTDITEFIEILSETPNFDLSGYIVVLYNGSNDESYDTIDLNGFSTDADGFFIIGSDLTPGVDIALGADNTIQNGADAVAIYLDDASNFPNNTPVTAVNLVDAVVYGTADDDDMELLNGLNETVQYDESLNGNKDTESIQFDGSGGFCVIAPTLRLTNSCVLGTNDLANEQFSIYPNPATKGYVNISSKVIGSKKVSVFDVLGKQVINTKLSNDRLDISSLNSGIYILKVVQGTSSITKKLVVK